MIAIGQWMYSSQSLPLERGLYDRMMRSVNPRPSREVAIVAGALFFTPGFFIALGLVPLWILIVSIIGVRNAGAAAPAAVTLQAESAALSGGTVAASSHGGYNGAGFADFGGQDLSKEPREAINNGVPPNNAPPQPVNSAPANGATAGDVPEDIVLAIKRMILTNYEYREDLLAGTIVAEIPTDARMLLAPYRIVRV